MPNGVEIAAPSGVRYDEILTLEALDLVGVLHINKPLGGVGVATLVRVVLQGKTFVCLLDVV